MDKNAAQQMDPKLKEIYDRVMGVNVKSAQANIPPQASQPTPSPKPQQTQSPQASMPPPTSGVISYSAHAASTTTGKKGGKTSSVPLMILFGIVFVLAYTIIWAKIFNVKVPFLPF